MAHSLLAVMRMGVSRYPAAAMNAAERRQDLVADNLLAGRGRWSGQSQERQLPPDTAHPGSLNEISQ